MFIVSSFFAKCKIIFGNTELEKVLSFFLFKITLNEIYRKVKSLHGF
ncbi:hypothetical protein LEP1GSC007_2484 [Leptospira interrogans serovar Bulgarica str. Mallika]|uniref:Uncharacterized protein n=1 Tax=Leptospira interrogans str. UI 12621 TaxID=1049937 RepID=A0A0F6HDD7_LEPIR|nr:hypothetical protein LEP1GSC007_2484 [Leptospira interrogans serovar Bulgarica str. Mallika]EKO26334.1 hypothetical protein LEP1GSC104_3009 [Leptospira interrogans str. UI 12621]